MKKNAIVALLLMGALLTGCGGGDTGNGLSSGFEQTSSSGQAGLELTSEGETYTITWRDWDGTLLERDLNVPRGSFPSYDGETPTREPSAKYSFAFSGWSPMISEVTCNATYVAQYAKSVNSYEITWLDEDGSVLKTTSVPYGETPSYGDETPTKEGNAQYSYVFQGWYPSLKPVKGEATYTAKYSTSVNSYAITWKDWDGRILDVGDFLYGSIPVFEGASPVREYDDENTYVFSGWSPDIVPVVGDATYVAQYEATRSFLISYDANGGKEAPSPQLKEKQVDLAVSSIIPVRDGYTFTGWNCLLSDEVYQPGDLLSFDENATLFAMWCEHCSKCDGKGEISETKNCSTCSGKGKVTGKEDVWVSCSTCSGKGTTGTMTSKCSSCNGWGGAVLCSCSCGYSWYASSTNSRICAKCGKSVSGTRLTTCSSCGGKGTVTSKKTCSSCGGKGGTYRTSTYSSTCSSCDGSGKVTTKRTCSSCKGNPLIYPSAPTLVSIGNDSLEVKAIEGYEYSLDGKTWQSSPVFEGLNDETSYSAYQRIASTESKPFGVTSLPLNVTTTVACSITYELNGGTQSGNPTKLHNGHEGIALSTPTRKGYEFLGWTGSNGEVPQKEVNIEAGATGSFRYVANWQVLTYKITYDLDGGECDSNPTTYTVEDSFALNQPSKACYDFAGWYKGSNKITSISRGMVGDISLVAHWSATSYSISYDLNGGTASSDNPTSYTVESGVSLSAPTREGYTFVGWKDADGNGVSGIAKGSSGDLALTAQWTANKYNLNVSSSDLSKGSVTVSGTGCTDETITVTAIPARDCFFKGWYNGDVLVSKDSPFDFIMPASDYSLTAKFWTKAEEEEEEARRKALGIVPVIDSASNTLTYGLYPQKRVSDSSTLASLNALTSAESNGWYLLNGEYYAKKEANPYDSNFVFDDGTKIVSETTYWFKCEPIKWKILSSTDDGEYSLVSTVLLDAHRYNEYYSWADENGYYANNYANSEIRKWLNGDFYDSAFSLGNSLIQTTTVDNSVSTTDSSSNSYACANTEDKVYLLSYKDYLNADYGFSTSYSNYDAARRCKTTDWARANGAYYSTDSSYLYNGSYWTRSPYSSRSSRACFVSVFGHLGRDCVSYSYCSVRPGLRIKVAQ